MTIVIHHNVACGTSRNTLDMIRAAGEEPVVIDYLSEGWTRSQLLALFAAADLTPRAALRETKSPAADLGLLEEGVYAVAFSYPVVPRDRARIRTQMSAALTDDDLELALAAFARVKARLL